MAVKHNAEYENSELYKIRHSTAHIMAEAVLEKFPEGKVAIGPAIADGFYYDFDLPRALTPEDLEEIEHRMKKIIKGNHPFIKISMSIYTRLMSRSQSLLPNQVCPSRISQICTFQTSIPQSSPLSS